MNSNQKFSIILADPPWRFKVWSRETGCGRAADAHYPTMELDDLKRLPIWKIAAENCALFLWTPPPLLQEGLEVIKSWGFKFKTVAFTWIKLNKKSGGLFFGMGYWTRANPEFCLLATKGQIKRVNKSVHSVIISPIRKHSQKPPEVRERIVRLLGPLPRIELFAREICKGWVSVGDEIDGRDIRSVLNSEEVHPKNLTQREIQVRFEEED